MGEGAVNRRQALLPRGAALLGDQKGAPGPHPRHTFGVSESAQTPLTSGKRFLSASNGPLVSFAPPALSEASPGREGRIAAAVEAFGKLPEVKQWQEARPKTMF